MISRTKYFEKVNETMKKLRYFYITLFIVLLLLVGCANSNKPLPDQSERKIIAVSTIGPTHPWPEGVYYYAKKEVERIALENDWDYICVTGNTTNEQSSQIIELVDLGVDCIIMLPMDGAALKTAAKTVQKAGIPLVIFDREIPDFAPTATVKGDNPGIGETTADIFNREFPLGTCVLELMGDASTVPFQRAAGYDDVILPSFETIRLGYTGWQRALSKQIFEEWVEKSSQAEIDEIGAIFTHEDEIALGVLDALDTYNNDETFKKNFRNLKMIAASSGAQEIYQIIQEENVYDIFSLTYSPKMVVEAVKIGEKILKNEEYVEMTIIPTVRVDINNVDLYIDEQSPF